MVHVLDVLQRLDTLHRTVDGDIVIAFREFRERVDDALGNGVFLGQVRHSVPFLQHDIGNLVNLYPFFLEKFHHILEGQDIVDEVAFLRLAFLGDAGADEDDLGLGMLFLEDFGVGHHRGIDRC